MSKTTIKLIACASLAPLALAAAPAIAEPTPQRAKLEQNGTTVPTASEVKAPKRERRARPARETKMSQNGTTVPTASELKAPERERRAPRPGREPAMSQNGTTVPTASNVEAPKREQRGMIVPAVQQAHATRTSKRKMEQNGTTVSTASEVQAPKQED